MNHQVDLAKKDKTQREYFRSCKGWLTLSYGIVIFFILFNVLFGLYGLVKKDTFIVKDIYDSGYGLKDTLLVWVIIIAVDVILVFLWFIQHILAIGITGKYIIQRVNENLFINESYIEYSYQNAVGASPGDRVVVKIPLDSINSMIITENIRKIEIVGKICSVYYDNYVHRKTRTKPDDFEEGVFVIFDYFVPELIPCLKNIAAEKE